DDHAAALLAATPRSSALADRVRAALAEELRGGEPSAGATAARLKMSVRSLHRGLADDGASFGALLEQLRRELAVRYLDEDRVSIAEIAFLPGFAELSSFYKAFKRWTGATPAAYRARPR